MNTELLITDTLKKIEKDIIELKGLNKTEAVCFENLLKQIIEKWNYRDIIPKYLIKLFVDFYPSIKSVINKYDNEKIQEIYEFEDKMNEIISICLEYSK